MTTHKPPTLWFMAKVEIPGKRFAERRWFWAYDELDAMNRAKRDLEPLPIGATLTVERQHR